MTKTVIEHVLSRLRDIGITDVFGVPGDYAFTINDAICNDREIRWVGCCNELNAAYAADGYARIKGVAALCTTYGVGELSTINGVAGAPTPNIFRFSIWWARRTFRRKPRAPSCITRLAMASTTCFDV